MTTVRIEASDNCDFFTYVQESDIPADNIINFTTPIQASNVKIIILAADPANADSKPMALNRFKCILQRGFLKMGQPRPLFVLSNTNVYKKTVDINGS